jgi:hypothetical protein
MDHSRTEKNQYREEHRVPQTGLLDPKNNQYKDYLVVAVPAQPPKTWLMLGEKLTVCYYNVLQRPRQVAARTQPIL